MQNFRTPYLTKSFKDFWHRWHISLSSWFRDYVYIPLGGNRVSQSRWIINILLTFTLSGLWHGAALTFIIWGFLHGLFLVAENFITISGKPDKRVSWMGYLVTFIAVNIVWVFFRADSLQQSVSILSGFKTLNFDFVSQGLNLFSENNEFREYLISIMVSFPLFILMEFRIGKTDFNEVIKKRNRITRWAVYLAIAFLILIFGVLKTTPEFIYFQF
jgi:D-alanyl-lipoteichoic acid acyltransferase DltB (MBOAT superfamily)